MQRFVPKRDKSFVNYFKDEGKNDRITRNIYITNYPLNKIVRKPTINRPFYVICQYNLKMKYHENNQELQNRF